jgi:hypothetical protein
MRHVCDGWRNRHHVVTGEASVLVLQPSNGLFEHLGRGQEWINGRKMPIAAISRFVAIRGDGFALTLGQYIQPLA